MSEEFGTPLHVACKISNLKIVQKLVLIGANIEAVDSKGKIAKNLTDNQKIVFLIEKY
jgi:ankyrin repeat protein